MGCFLGCFGGSKDRRHGRLRNKVVAGGQRHGSEKPVHSTVSSEQDINEKPTNLISGLIDKSEEQLSLSLSTGRKVKFDTNVKTHEHVPIHESTESLLDDDKVDKKEEKNLSESSQAHSLSESHSITSSVGSYPPNNRYENCRDSDDEMEELEDGDLDDDDEQEFNGEYDEDMNDRNVISPESMESSTKISSAPAMEDLPGQEASTMGSDRNVRDRSVYVHPVLNPIENLTQWRAVKSKGTTTPVSKDFKPKQEEPIASFSSKSSFKSKRDQPNNPNEEIAVDTSLSNWLVSPQTTNTKKATFTGFEPISSEKSTSRGSNSAISFEDRPILGALTLDELKQFSASPSPKKSPSQSPDEMPIIGNVGSYWNHNEAPKSSSSASSYKGIPNTTSKYREDKRVNWHTTPFETRLERALMNGGEAEV